MTKFGGEGKTSLERSSVLRAPEYAHVEAHWFCPDYWGGQVEAVSAGGRGSAWFIRSASGPLVLRHYRRGGLVAHLSQRSYIFTGFDRTRSFAEFRLLQKLYDRGLPVPKPVAAIACRKGVLAYEAAILIERIERAKPMPEHCGLSTAALWRDIGQTLGLFHREGLEHVDLNCDNILVAKDSIYLIDFDRCTLHVNADDHAGWKKDNLSRLRRSVEKRCKAISPVSREKLWHELLDAYNGTAQ